MVKPVDCSVRLRQRAYVLRTLLTLKIRSQSVLLLYDPYAKAIIERVMTTDEMGESGVHKHALLGSDLGTVTADVVVVWCVSYSEHHGALRALLDSTAVKEVHLHAASVYRDPVLMALERHPKVTQVHAHGLHFVAVDSATAILPARSSVGIPTWHGLTSLAPDGGLVPEARGAAVAWMASGLLDICDAMGINPYLAHTDTSLTRNAAEALESLLTKRVKVPELSTEHRYERPWMLIVDRSLDLVAPVRASLMTGVVAHNIQGIELTANDHSALMDTILPLSIEEGLARCKTYEAELEAELERLSEFRPKDDVWDRVHGRDTTAQFYHKVLDRELKLRPGIEAMLQWLRHAAVTHRQPILMGMGNALTMTTPTMAALDLVMCDRTVSVEHRLCLLLQLAAVGHCDVKKYEEQLRVLEGVDTSLLDYLHSVAGPPIDQPTEASGRSRLVELVQALTGELDTEGTNFTWSTLSKMQVVDPYATLVDKKVTPVDPFDHLGLVPSVVVLVIGGGCPIEQFALQAHVSAPTTYVCTHLASDGAFLAELRSLGRETVETAQD